MEEINFQLANFASVLEAENRRNEQLMVELQTTHLVALIAYKESEEFRQDTEEYT